MYKGFIKDVVNARDSGVPEERRVVFKPWQTKYYKWGFLQIKFFLHLSCLLEFL